MNKFLDKSGLQYFWQKVKAYIDNNTTTGGGATNWSDITTIMHVVILNAESWSSDNTQTVSVLGVLSDWAKQMIYCAPYTSSYSEYYASNINILSRTTDSLTFKADTIPYEDLTCYVAVVNVQAIYGDNGNVPTLQHEWYSPEMTSDTTPVPYIVSSSSIFSPGDYPPAYTAFGKRDGTVQYVLLTETDDAYIQIYLQNLLSIGGFRIYSPMSENAHFNKNLLGSFTFQGSNDGNTWTELKNVTGLSTNAWSQTTYVDFMLDSIATFRYYRFSNLTRVSGTSNYVSIGIIEFYI